MKYIIASTAVTDEIHFVDGKRTEIVAGGAQKKHRHLHQQRQHQKLLQHLKQQGKQKHQMQLQVI